MKEKTKTQKKDSEKKGRGITKELRKQGLRRKQGL